MARERDIGGNRNWLPEEWENFVKRFGNGEPIQLLNEAISQRDADSSNEIVLSQFGFKVVGTYAQESVLSNSELLRTLIRVSKECKNDFLVWRPNTGMHKTTIRANELFVNEAVPPSTLYSST